MAATSGAQNSDLMDLENEDLYGRVRDLLGRVPFEFQFFQAVRLLERMMPSRAAVGQFSDPTREVVRFGAYWHHRFPASQIQEIRFRDGAPFMLVNFMGLTGPMGIMPLYYTSLMMERVRDKDYGFQAFFDLFNHRMISHFYQAWEKYRFTVAYERGERDPDHPHRDVFSQHLLDLIGLGTRGLQERLAVLDDSLLFYCGLLSLQPRSAQALKQILVDYFDVPVEIEQFIGAWYRLSVPDQCRLRMSTDFSEQVSVGAVVGDEVWDPQYGARVILGPLDLRHYLDFLPNGTAYRPLQALCRFFSGREIDFEVQLILKREEVPACELGDESETAPMLGWLTWNKTKEMQRDPRDAILRITSVGRV